jgi:hypothetical protein
MSQNEPLISKPGDPVRCHEAARCAVELRWHAPRKWGARNLPHAGRFYSWAFFTLPSRRIWTYAEATGVIGPGGIETTDLAILMPDIDPSIPELKVGEEFDLSRAGIEGVALAAHGRVLKYTAGPAKS